MKGGVKMSRQTKNCDYCGRKIDKSALLCPFCFHQVEEIDYSPAMPFGQAPIQKATEENGPDKNDLKKE